jgi:hypothetical protein
MNELQTLYADLVSSWSVRLGLYCFVVGFSLCLMLVAIRDTKGTSKEDAAHDQLGRGSSIETRNRQPHGGNDEKSDSSPRKPLD